MSTIKYSEMTPLEHCLARPDTYIGGIRVQTREDWLIDVVKEEPIEEEEDVLLEEIGDEKESVTIEEEVEPSDIPKLVYRSFESNSGLERLFIEAQSNAIDNAWRSAEANVAQTMIEIEVKPDGWTSVKNDGLIIPLEIHEESKLWNPEFIFGRLRTSSNYDDTEERKTSGKNGLGIKLTNIYSKEFQVEIFDKERSLKYTQVWTDHMKNKKEAVIATLKKSGQPKTSYTKISWLPDFSYFSLPNYNEDMIKLFRRYAYDTCMVTGLKVTFNGEVVPSKSLKAYTKAFGSNEVMLLESKDCKVAICGNPPKNKEYRQLSFVNGCYTSEGGVHVDGWMRPLIKGIMEKLEAKFKNSKFTYFEVKKYFSIVVSASVVRPEFGSQTKNLLVSPMVENSINEKVIASIMRWSFVKRIGDESKYKEMASLKKTEKRGYVKVDGLDPANFAGTAKSKDCILVICEGESAKTYTVAGLDVGIEGKKGRDYIGIYPIRGKILNTRNATPKKIQESREITAIRTALGLQLDVDYSLEENRKKLRYGKVLVVSDADSDGRHITGLLLNIFHSMYPTLMTQDFIYSMRTPIMTIYSKRGEKDIYTETEEKQYREQLGQERFTTKWRKGLGSSKRDEVQKSFGKRMVRFIMDQHADQNMIKAFDKKFSDNRKTWLAEFEKKEDEPVLVNGMEVVPVSHFINQEFIEFSMEDCQRSLPHVLDGLKESQRKVLYACFKKGLWKTPVKVAQLGGSVAETTQYHHGEQNLLDTIVKLAQDFVGSNNLPYLTRDGQFGSRLEGGEDAAAARYIYTHLEPHMKFLFREEDEPLYTYVESDGQTVEPESYLPILPMLLVNGCTGIGTGWSSEIPAFQPKQLVEWIHVWLSNQEQSDHLIQEEYPELVPWYKGFTGKIELEKQNGQPVRAVTHGSFGPTKKKNTYEITELPIGTWTNKYKDQIEDWYVNKQLDDRINKTTVDKVYFEIKPSDDFEMSEKNLKLVSYLSMTNMVAFNKDGKITKYTLGDMLEEYCSARLDLYKRRREFQLSKIEEQIKFESNRIRFLDEVMREVLTLFMRSQSWIEAKMIELEYDKKDDSYDYLINMPIRSFTKEKVEELEREKSRLQKQHADLMKKTPSQMWKEELGELMRFL